MFYKKVPLVSVEDYLTYIKKNSNINFQFDIIRSNIIDIQVLGYDFINESDEIYNPNGITILANFHNQIRDNLSAENRLLNSTVIKSVIKSNNPKLPSTYIVKLKEKDIILLHEYLKEFLHNIYQYINGEMCTIQFFQYKAEKAEQINFVNVPLLEYYFGVKIKM